MTVLACWSASGIVFGFAALKPVLVEEGVYRERCTPAEIAEGIELCSQQDLRYVASHVGVLWPNDGLEF